MKRHNIVIALAILALISLSAFDHYAKSQLPIAVRLNNRIIATERIHYQGEEIVSDAFVPIVQGHNLVQRSRSDVTIKFQDSYTSVIESVEITTYLLDEKGTIHRKLSTKTRTINEKLLRKGITVSSIENKSHDFLIAYDVTIVESDKRASYGFVFK